jgi:hypothetical protein
MGSRPAERRGQAAREVGERNPLRAGVAGDRRDEAAVSGKLAVIADGRGRIHRRAIAGLRWCPVCPERAHR